MRNAIKTGTALLLLLALLCSVLPTAFAADVSNAVEIETQASMDLDIPTSEENETGAVPAEEADAPFRLFLDRFGAFSESAAQNVSDRVASVQGDGELAVFILEDDGTVDFDDQTAALDRIREISGHDFQNSDALVFVWLVIDGEDDKKWVYYTGKYELELEQDDFRVSFDVLEEGFEQISHQAGFLAAVDVLEDLLQLKDRAGKDEYLAPYYAAKEKPFRGFFDASELFAESDRQTISDRVSAVAGDGDFAMLFENADPNLDPMDEDAVFDHFQTVFDHDFGERSSILFLWVVNENEDDRQVVTYSGKYEAELKNEDFQLFWDVLKRGIDAYDFTTGLAAAVGVLEDMLQLKDLSDADSYLSACQPAKNAPHTAEYQDPETSYRAVIADEAGLLADEDVERVLESMKPLCAYANIAVYTVDTPTAMQDYERAREKRRELFGDKENGAVFMIDMYLRRIIIQRRGNMEQYFSNARANNITNNVSSLAKKEQYADVCVTAMSQMLSVIKGEQVPSSMKYISNAVIAVMLALLITFGVARVTSSTFVKPVDDGAFVAREDLTLGESVDKGLVRVEKVYSPPASSSSSSCGSSCSSCGSSCSSCGSSCGGSSF